jgi:hypothetical protein
LQNDDEYMHSVYNDLQNDYEYLHMIMYAKNYDHGEGLLHKRERAQVHRNTQGGAV